MGNEHRYPLVLWDWGWGGGGPSSKNCIHKLSANGAALLLLGPIHEIGHVHVEWCYCSGKIWLCAGNPVTFDLFRNFRPDQIFLRYTPVLPGTPPPPPPVRWRREMLEETWLQSFGIRSHLVVSMDYAKECNTIEDRRHTPWPRVRCHGCWFTHSQFHQKSIDVPKISRRYSLHKNSEIYNIGAHAQWLRVNRHPRQRSGSDERPSNNV